MERASCVIAALVQPQNADLAHVPSAVDGFDHFDDSHSVRRPRQLIASPRSLGRLHEALNSQTMQDLGEELLRDVLSFTQPASLCDQEWTLHVV